MSDVSGISYHTPLTRGQICNLADALISYKKENPKNNYVTLLMLYNKHIISLATSIKENGPKFEQNEAAQKYINERDKIFEKYGEKNKDGSLKLSSMGGPFFATEEIGKACQQELNVFTAKNKEIVTKMIQHNKDSQKYLEGYPEEQTTEVFELKMLNYLPDGAPEIILQYLIR